MIGRALPTAPGQKVDFNALKAPSNYVPGLGRGATGFTTRSDIGPARGGPTPGDGGGDKDGGDDEQKFDAFMGADAGVFAGGEYDEDDREADRIWEGIDDHMDERRRRRVPWRGPPPLPPPPGADAGGGGHDSAQGAARCPAPRDERAAGPAVMAGPPATRVDLKADLRASRGSEKREALMKERIEKYRAENPKITEQFADLKRQLAEVRPARWRE
ncbi:splicing factor, component of the U4/U6-U5snRNP complex [Monoraphidium neglectum]|uniref:Splicing factor, component of the U4/U6-U5snRNP complex n=1 Tax=Monoraphidium neglectum TaxID=145388 RepID=A0A0D2MCJ6_9CHLO|nr:splicing factor, component of the U4/U6-U5snRNP complex [Monoraphidium neglectum]KIZ00965.1 splicing factor, component of the U4/U6-U5snRNP complex [Monoraphidium neglectum]|eukprot:XP_013899984.1 splicing factor, component of the U4/U6-U5snRNP complex [Monoraphidium neglectum]